jgi:hypothetical protein
MLPYVHGRRCARCARPPFISGRFAERSERGSEFGTDEFRLFPCREVTALIDLIEINEVAIGTLGPALWRTVDLARKHPHPTGIEISAVFCNAAPKLLLFYISSIWFDTVNL